MNAELLDEKSTKLTSRRQALRCLGLGAAGLTAAGLLAPTARAQEITASQGPSDIDILQFALNLEYLEAEYYTYATTGHGIEQEGIDVFGKGNPGPVIIKANPMVPFGGAKNAREYALEIAADERDHVTFIRGVLKSLGATPAARPTIELKNSWNALAQAAGLGSSFDPFANSINFLLGAFVFEDVGVTGYRGAAPLLNNATVLSGAAGLLGVESYHAAMIRTALFARRDSAINAAAKKISNLRDALDRDGDKDQGLIRNGLANIVPTNDNGLVFARNVRQVLNIVYFAPNASAGGFFPNGINP